MVLMAKKLVDVYFWWVSYILRHILLGEVSGANS